jgi:hypothetical protein
VKAAVIGVMAVVVVIAAAMGNRSPATPSVAGREQAPLDFAVLEPGDESPFVVTIPNVTEVAKYRVSFRTERGMMRHVDRRADQMQLAHQ